MEKLFRIWLLSLITVSLFYLAQITRYVIYPETKIKYDRWTGQTSRLIQFSEKDKESKKEASFSDEIDRLMKLKHLQDTLYALRTLRLQIITGSITSGLTNKEISEYIKKHVVADTLDIKFDSLVSEALYLGKQLEKRKFTNELNQLVIEMQNQLRENTKVSK